MTAWNPNAKYTIAVDFDGVIHSYTTKWTVAKEIHDPPVPGAIAWLNQMAEKFDIVIHTTRAHDPEAVLVIRQWLVMMGFAAAHIHYPRPEGFSPVRITAEKPAALIYLDDRAVRFTGENFPTADEVHRLRPWNKPPVDHHFQQK